jgi:hypothetical protein
MTQSFPPTTETLTARRSMHRPDRVGLFLQQRHPAYVEYERMHKRLVGPGTVGKLMRIHSELVDAPLHTDNLSIAGWAAAEAALVASNHPQEERLDFLESAADAWDAAIEHRRDQKEYAAENETYEDTELSRLELAKLCVPLIEGMIRGDVTKEVRERLYDGLMMLAAKNSLGLVAMERRGDDPSMLIGLGHELNAMLAVNRLLSPTLIAMPALARGDSGHFHPEQTHDIDLLHLQWGKIHDVTTLESKARPRAQHYKRYEAAIVNGRIHLFSKNGNSPVDTAVLFLKEQNEAATPDEIEELEGMTDVIVHLARHQMAGSPDISPHCRDVRRCRVVPQHRSATRALAGLAIAS